MESFRFRSSERVLSAQVIHALRQFTVLDISELKARAASGRPLLEFPILDNNWQESRRTIKRLLARIERGELLLDITEYSEGDGFAPQEEPLSAAALKERLHVLREINIEQDMASQLEMGYIKSPREYEPTDEDEA